MGTLFCNLYKICNLPSIVKTIDKEACAENGSPKDPKWLK